jgi:hypothetical protein
MDFADIMVLVLWAAADICLIAHLRRRRARYMRMDRMTRSLELHIRRELAPESIMAPQRRRVPEQARAGSS